MKGRNYSDFNYWREIFFGVRFRIFYFFRFDIKILIQKLFDKNRLEKTT